MKEPLKLHYSHKLLFDRSTIILLWNISCWWWCLWPLICSINTVHWSASVQQSHLLCNGLSNGPIDWYSTRAFCLERRLKCVWYLYVVFVFMQYSFQLNPKWASVNQMNLFVWLIISTISDRDTHNLHNLSLLSDQTGEDTSVLLVKYILL